MGADPALIAEAASALGSSVRYIRWHGSPRMYYSSYGEDALIRLADELIKFESATTAVYCIFDNAAAGAAILNALELSERLRSEKSLQS